MSYKGYVGEIPAGEGGANFDSNPGRVPITDLIDADGVITQDGLLQKEPGADLFDAQGILGAPVVRATVVDPPYAWNMAGVTLKGTAPAIVVGSTITSIAPVSSGPPYIVQLTVGAGGIGSTRCIVVSSSLLSSSYVDATCTDDAGNVYVQVADAIEWPSTLRTRLFVALNVIALSAGQKITLTFAGCAGDSHVAIANAWAGILSAGAVDRTAYRFGVGSPIDLVMGSLGSLPQLVLGAGNMVAITVPAITTTDGFTKCGENWNGPGAGHNRAWQEYRVDAATPTVVGLHDWRPSSSVKRIVTACLDGKIYKEVGGDLDSVLLVSGLSTTARPGRFIEGGQEAAGNNRKLFYFNGVDPVKILSGDGVTMATIWKPAADWSGSNQPLGGMIQRNRLAAWGNANDPHRLYLSTASDHEDFQTTTGSDPAATYSCYPSVGDRLYSGAKHLGLLWLFKWPRGIFWLDDSDPDMTLWSLQMHTDALGCTRSPYGALGIDNDIMFLAADGSFHLLSATQGSVVRDSNLSMAMHHAKWLRDNINLSKLSQAISVWYPHKKWAIWGLPSIGSSINDLVVLFDFSDVHEAGTLPRLFISHRDNVDALALRLHSDQIERPMLGEGGLVWLLDRDTRNKNGSGYLGRYQTARTDFSHIEARFAAREKNFDAIEIVKTPTTGTLTVKVEIDGTVRETVTFDLSRRRQRRTIGGHGYELSLIGENEVANVNFLIERHLVFFSEAEEGRI